MTHLGGGEVAVHVGCEWVNDAKVYRAPLLFTAGGEDHIMPAAVKRSNVRKYEHSPAVTDFHGFAGRSHFTVGHEGWEAVADYALGWATANARTPARFAEPTR